MSPRIGRPPKNEKSKNVSLQLRITQTTAEKLKECADTLNVSITEVIEKGIDFIYEQVTK